MNVYCSAVLEVWQNIFHGEKKIFDLSQESKLFITWYVFLYVLPDFCNSPLVIQAGFASPITRSSLASNRTGHAPPRLGSSPTSNHTGHVPPRSIPPRGHSGRDPESRELNRGERLQRPSLLAVDSRSLCSRYVWIPDRARNDGDGDGVEQIGHYGAGRCVVSFMGRKCMPERP